MVLPRSGGVVPLYCIVDGHSLDDIYKWQRGTKDLVENTPVMWIKQPGFYSCSVSRGGVSCKSSTIQALIEACSHGE